MFLFCVFRMLEPLNSHQWQPVESKIKYGTVLWNFWGIHAFHRNTLIAYTLSKFWGIPDLHFLVLISINYCLISTQPRPAISWWNCDGRSYWNTFGKGKLELENPVSPIKFWRFVINISIYSFKILALYICFYCTVILEAQKCLFNLVFSHTPSRLMISNSSVAEAALLRISSVTEIPSIPHEVLLFDLKILFLLTALCISSRYVHAMNTFFSYITKIHIIYLHRPIIRYSSQGIHRLVKLLDTCLVQGVDQLTNDSVALCCESLKVIFNLLLPTTETDSADSSSTPSVIPEEDLQVQRRLMYIIRLLLSVKSNSLEKREDLKRYP